MLDTLKFFVLEKPEFLIAMGIAMVISFRFADDLKWTLSDLFSGK